MFRGHIASAYPPRSASLRPAFPAKPTRCPPAPRGTSKRPLVAVCC